MRKDDERLQDILEAIEQIEKYASKGLKALEEDELVQVWMVHYLGIIGEAANRLSDETKKKYPSVPWRKIVGMRNYIVHEYFKIDAQIIWNAIEKEIPKLKAVLLEG